MWTGARTTTALLAPLLFFGCLAPEQFTATLHVGKDKAYGFTYDGTVVFTSALGVIKERGRLLPSEDAQLREASSEIRKEPGVTTVDYVGNGRFRVRVKEQGFLQSDRKLFLNLVEIRVQPDGHTSILGAEVRPENRQELLSAGLRLNGVLKVTSAIPVLRHNAAGTPWFGGLIGSYNWAITLNQLERPSIVLQ